MNFQTDKHQKTLGGGGNPPPGSSTEFSIPGSVGCCRWTRTDIAPRSGAAVVEVDIPSGYHALRRRLNKVVSKSPLNMHRFRSPWGKLFAYFDYVSWCACVRVGACVWRGVCVQQSFYVLKNRRKVMKFKLYNLGS